jgi:hypothetical protein
MKARMRRHSLLLFAGSTIRGSPKAIPLSVFAHRSFSVSETAIIYLSGEIGRAEDLVTVI